MDSLEVVVHGRGGQGAVTFSQILAVALSCCNKYCQAFPSFGPERCGAPVEAFIRISDNVINIRSQVYNPDISIVLDSSLLKTIDVTEGLKKNSILIINSTEKADKLNIKNRKSFKIYTVDATSIALKIFKRDIVNTAMLGAFAKITKIVTLEAISNGLEQRFHNRELIDMNKRAVEEVYKKS